MIKRIKNKLKEYYLAFIYTHPACESYVAENEENNIKENISIENIGKKNNFKDMDKMIEKIDNKYK